MLPFPLTLIVVLTTLALSCEFVIRGELRISSIFAPSFRNAMGTGI